MSEENTPTNSVATPDAATPTSPRKLISILQGDPRMLSSWSTPPKEVPASIDVKFPDTAIFTVAIKGWFPLVAELRKGTTIKSRSYLLRYDDLPVKVHVTVERAEAELAHVKFADHAYLDKAITAEEQRCAFALRWDNLLDYSEWRTYNVGVFLMYAKDAEHLCKRINEWIAEKRRDAPEAPDIPRVSDSDEAWELHRQKCEDRENFVRDLPRPDFIPEDLFAVMRNVGGGEWKDAFLTGRGGDHLILDTCPCIHEL